MMTPWLCFYIYYHDSHDVLLKECLDPTLRLLQQQQLIRTYFYLRYWQNGPHIRLRMKVNKENLTQTECFLTEKLNEFLSHTPSITSLSQQRFNLLAAQFAALENTVVNNLLENNNSFKKVIYESEFNKYGGKCGILLAEQFFYHSSKIALELLKRDSYKKERLLLAITSMCLALHSWNLSTDEAIEFFKQYYNYWKTFLNIKKVNYSQHFAQSYQLIKNPLQKLYFAEHVLFKEWKFHISNVYKRLQIHQTHIYPQMKFKSQTISIRPDFYLLNNYLHTHNNRYGIQIQEEALLGYWGIQFFSHLLHGENHV